jgi:hypothetical protein
MKLPACSETQQQRHLTSDRLNYPLILFMIRTPMLRVSRAMLLSELKFAIRPASINITGSHGVGGGTMTTTHKQFSVQMCHTGLHLLLLLSASPRLPSLQSTCISQHCSILPPQISLQTSRGLHEPYKSELHVQVSHLTCVHM